MRKDRKIPKQLRAIRNYITHLRICVFNDWIEGIKESSEIEISERVDILLKNDYRELKPYICERKPSVDCKNGETVSQINGLFRAIEQIESEAYGETKIYIPLTDIGPQYLYA